MPDQQVSEKLTKAIRVWAKRKQIRPADFARAMGWSYNHAWRVLNKGDAFTLAACGQFAFAFGMETLTELFRIAGLNLKGTQEGSRGE